MQCSYITLLVLGNRSQCSQPT